MTQRENVAKQLGITTDAYAALVAAELAKPGADEELWDMVDADFLFQLEAWMPLGVRRNLWMRLHQSFYDHWNGFPEDI